MTQVVNRQDWFCGHKDDQGKEEHDGNERSREGTFGILTLQEPNLPNSACKSLSLTFFDRLPTNRYMIFSVCVGL